MTTPTAAVPATPAAVTENAPAPVPVTPAATAAPAPAAVPPAAAPVVPAAATPAPAPVESLLGDVPPADAPKVQTEAEKLAAAKALVDAAADAANPNSGKAWVLAEGVLGTGEKPDWFKSDKYKSVADQAKAYTSLESRFGSFVGAPPEGKYEFKAPDDLPGVQLQSDHPMLAQFGEWAKKSQLSQAGYNELMGMFAHYELSQIPKVADIKAKLGPEADTRINGVVNWAKANLDAEGNALIREATKGANAAAVFQTIDKMIAKTGARPMPRTGDDAANVSGGGLTAVQEMHGKRDANGKLLVDSDPKYRAKVDQAYRDYYTSQQA